MRQIRYAVACSLDGYIAGPNGEFDWIPQDPEVNFEELFAPYDTILVGRKSLLVTGAEPDAKEIMPGMKTYLFSTTLTEDAYPNFTLISENVEETVQSLKQKDGKNIWLFGGGELFKSLNDLHLVDGIDLGIVPILLGNGIPLAPISNKQTKLTLVNHRTTSAGMVGVEYNIEKSE